MVLGKRGRKRGEPCYRATYAVDNAGCVDKKEVIIKWRRGAADIGLHKVKQGGWTVVERHQPWGPSRPPGREEKKESIWREDRAEREVIYGTPRFVSWTNHGTMMTAGLAGGRPINHGLQCGNLCLYAPLCLYGVCHQ